MCLNNCNIEVEENKDKKINSDLTYEERLKIEDMLRSKKKYTIQQIADEIKRNKSIISREIKRIVKKNGIMRQEYVKEYIQQQKHKESMNIGRKKLEESHQ